MNQQGKLVVVVVIVGVLAAGGVAVSGLVTAQAQSGATTGNTTGNSTDDTAFDDPESIGDNSSIANPSSVGSNNTSIENSSSFVNTNVTYKVPGNVTGSEVSNNSSYAMGSGQNASNSSGVTYSCGGSLLDALLSGNLDMVCRLKKWVVGMLFGGLLSFIQGVWNAIVEGLFKTPAPMMNGDPAIFAEPTNAPWNTLWNIAMYRMVPIGLVIWAFIYLGALGITSILPLGPSGEYKKRQMNNKAVLAFLGILGSWGLGSTFLWLTKGVTAAIMPSGDQIASGAAMVMANNQAAVILVIAAYLTGGTLVAYFGFLILFRFLMAGIFMIALPILIPLIMIDVGPFEYISSSIERFVDVAIMFVIMTIPMGLVLQGGYAIVNGLNQGSGMKSAAISTFLTASAGNGVLVFTIWILAGLVPLFMYRQLGHVKGIASSTMNAGRRASERLKELSETDPSEDNSPPYGPGAMQPDDITEESDVQRSSDTGEFGGALKDGRVHAGDGQSEPTGMLGRGPGMLADPRDPNASSTPNRLDNGHPAASALPSGDGRQQTSNAGQWSQFTDRVGNVGDWVDNARSNLNERINNAQEMKDTVRENGGNITAGIAGATAGFFGGSNGGSEDNSSSTSQNTTWSNAGSQTTSASNTGTSEQANQNIGSNVENQPENIGSNYYREEKGEQIYVPKSADGLPSHMQIGVLKDKGFDTIRGGMPMDSDDLIDGSASQMKNSYAEEGEVFVARDQESGQLYDLSEIEGNQEPPERDHEREKREEGSARDVKNAREESDD